MKLINPDRLIEDKGFFIEDECGRITCVVAAQDIRNAPAVNLVPVMPGHTDQHNISEMSFHNGEEKFREKVINSLMGMQTHVKGVQHALLVEIVEMVGGLK